MRDVGFPLHHSSTGEWCGYFLLILLSLSFFQIPFSIRTSLPLRLSSRSNTSLSLATKIEQSGFHIDGTRNHSFNGTCCCWMKPRAIWICIENGKILKDMRVVVDGAIVPSSKRVIPAPASHH
jgi:hypothetical protein